MAKSLRSKKVQKNKTLKRRGYFGEVAKAREERIAEKLHGSLEKALQTAHPEPVELVEPVEPVAPVEESMDVEVIETKPRTKVSTAGWSKKTKHRKPRSKTKKFSQRPKH